MDTPMVANRQKLISISLVRTLDTVLRTYKKLWTIGTGGEKEPSESVQSARHDDDDDHNRYLLSVTISLVSDTFYLVSDGFYPESGTFSLVSGTFS